MAQAAYYYWYSAAATSCSSGRFRGCTAGRYRRGLLWRICVTNNAVQVAGYLGLPGRVLFMVGSDFGWRDRNFSRCRTYEPTEDGEALKEKAVAVPESAPEDNLGAIQRYPMASSAWMT